jgi:hypothetical protein
MIDPEANLQAAERIVAVLDQHGIKALVIGAVALAAYRYLRHTEDIDLGVNAPLPMLRSVADSLREHGFEVELREPDGDDPLGGVIDVTGPFGMVQIISFADRFPAVIDDALKLPQPEIRRGSRLRLIPVPHLIALKLYAGGYKSKADIVELLTRNPELDLAEIRQVCANYRLRGLDELIRELT